MPNNGRIIEWDELEFSLSGTASNSGSGAGVATYGYSGELTTASVPNTVTVDPGLELTIASAYNGTSGSWQVTYNGPGAPFGGYIVGGVGYRDTEIRAVLKDVKIYAKLTDALLRVTWSAIDIYVNGAFNITLPGSGVDETSAGVGPAYLPIIGLPPQLSGGVTANRTGMAAFSYDPCDPSVFAAQSYTSTTEGEVTGGFRFKEKGSASWVNLPCLPYTATPPEGEDCPYGLSAAGIITGTACNAITINGKSHTELVFTYEGRDFATNTVEITCVSGPGVSTIFYYEAPADCYDLCTGGLTPGYRDRYKSITRSESRGGSCEIIPNLEHRVKRHRPDYRFIWYRGDFPEVKAVASRTCEVNGVTETFTETPVVYPFVSVFLGTVGDDPHPIEDPLLDYPVYSPTQVSATKSEETDWQTFGTTLCDCADVLNYCTTQCPAGTIVCGLGCAITFPALLSPSKSEGVGWTMLGTVSPDEGGYQNHFVDRVRYFGTWCNRLWHFFHWREDWSGLDADTYWLPLRQQWLNNPDLPPGDRPATRTDLIGSCSNESGHTPFLDATVGGLRWIGVSRFQVTTPTIPDELATDIGSASLWKFGDYDSGTNTWSGTGSVSAGGITVDAGFTRITLTEILSWASVPYLYPLICDRVRIDGGMTNVASFEVFAVGRDGTRVSLGTTTGTKTIPRSTSTKYAGSWGIDNGLGIVTDEGIDLDATNGWSQESMSDPRRLPGFQLLPSNAPWRLEYELVPTDPLLAMTIKHPVWLADASAPTMFWESGKVCVLLWPDGQMLRLGNWTWYDPFLGLQNPPLVTGAGVKSSIIDALCTMRVIFEGRAHDDGLTTELSTRYDAYEGQAVSVVDKFSVSYQLPYPSGDWQGKAALVNTMAELPPFVQFPNRTYNETTWALTTTYACHVWDWAQHTRYLIHPDSPANLFNASDVQVTSALTTGVPAGWKITKHTTPIDNLEANDWKVRVGGTDLADVQPWRGYSLIFGEVPDPVAFGLSNARSREGFYAEAESFSNNLRVSFAYGSGPNPIFDHSSVADSASNCSSPSLVFEERRLWLAYVREDPSDSFNVFVRTSDDDARTWSAEESVSTGVATELFYDEDSKLLGNVVFRYDSGSSGPGKLFGKTRYAGDSAWSGEFTLTDGTNPLSVKDQGFDLVVAKDAQRAVLLVCIIEGETDRSTWVSFDDARTFKRL